jgi:hypothetical protein
MNILGFIFIIIGLYLIHINKNFEIIEEKKYKIPKVENTKKKIQNNTDIKTIRKELFWRPSPWEFLHGYKVDIKNKRFF